MTSFFIGVDIGTQGLRVVLMDNAGNQVAVIKESFGWSDNRDEQDPELWWSMLLKALRQLGELAAKAGWSPIRSIAVASTSGTVIPVDEHHSPLHAALMYSDNRSKEEALLCTEVAGKAINSSYGLPKMLWYIHNYPEQAARIRLWCHAVDYMTGKLSGVWGIADYTSALKSGYDLEANEWPNDLSATLNIPADHLPKVIAPGEIVGRLSDEVCESTGLPSSVLMVAGMTDGCASQIASGCCLPGHWNTTIGTTLVIKGITRQPVHDPLGRIYNHKHPQGYWMPGGASNTGADWISLDYGGWDLAELNQEAKQWLPTPWLSYALSRQGERFPFLNEDARGFDAPGLTAVQRYAARLESVAYMERLAYETIESLSPETIEVVYTAGGGSSSDTWLQIRSDVLQKPIYKMKHVEGADGAAMLAASATEFASLGEAVQQMSIVDKLVEPGVRKYRYQDNYIKFKALLKNKGYLN
ncbi:FGGY-family carbohydrate kinase [Paenibacillus sp. YIM B09110]|uniref:FGGY-family carbohydrate kinase n=1 Tax=Paenibacillus sp. YIM B09110 TaxID=3126102 RepID=UPI00301CD0ED